MKKFNLDPMSLDKETIAMLDDKQLQEIVGGLKSVPGTTANCGCGTTVCNYPPTCHTGGSAGSLE